MALFVVPFFRNKKHVVTYHGLDIVFKSKIYQYMLTHVLLKADASIAVSNEARNELLKRGFDEKKTYFIANGISIDDYATANERVDIILSIGRPIKRKGFSWFAQNVLPHLNKNLTYIVVGPELKNRRILSILEKILPYGLFHTYILFTGIPLDEIILKKLNEDPNINFQYVGYMSDSE
jgi:glycosyltransferase involved in cell wall biosynthesis